MLKFTKPLKNLTDEQLMQRAAAGNALAFEIIYERYAVKLTGYFHRMLWKNKELAQDSLQQLFEKIIEKPNLYNPDRSFKTWIYSVAHNMCKNQYRTMERHPSADIVQNPVRGEEQAVVNNQNFDGKRFIRELEKHLDTLESTHKQTFELRYFEHLSMKEIADIMECSEGTVKSRIFYTLKKLAAALKPYKSLLKN